MEMENKKFLIIFIQITLLIINIKENISSYLPIGLNQFNNYIYSNRMKIFIMQNETKKCSIHNGPNCYFVENIIMSNNNNNDKNNDDSDNTYLDYKKEWMNIFSKSNELSFLNIYNEINTNTLKYKNYISPKNDNEQVLHPTNLYLSLTFESYDDITIKGDTYAYPSKSIHFFTEMINIEIIGKLRLQYGEDLQLKNQMRYPCKTFGIIESLNLNIKLGGKKFICEYFYLRSRNDNIYKVSIEGYFGNTKIFSVSKEINYTNKKSWLKVTLPTNSEIDRLLLPGGIDVDNFKFVIPTLKQFDITAKFHANRNKRTKILVEDSDIY
jgi:hypothetical protein